MTLVLFGVYWQEIFSSNDLAKENLYARYIDYRILIKKVYWSTGPTHSSDHYFLPVVCQPVPNLSKTKQYVIVSEIVGSLN